MTPRWRPVAASEAVAGGRAVPPADRAGNAFTERP